METTTAGRTTTARWRTIVFRVIAGLFALVTGGFGVMFAVGSLVDEKENLHAIHNIGGLAGYTVVLAAGLALAAWRPERQIAAFQAAVAASVAAGAAGVLGGDFMPGAYVAPLVVVGVLAVLHPARAELLRFGRLNVPMLVLVLAALVPAVAYALTQASLQRHAFPGDPHGDMHHYSGAGATALILVAAALVASLGARGSRAVAWLAGGGAVLLGVVSLAYADHVSALTTPWAWMSIGWGAAVVAAGGSRSHAEGAA
jgi:hypothetical protein